jgi:hypothetical protein
MRDDAPTNKDPTLGATRRARAYEIASYTTTSDFIPPPANLKEVFSEETKRRRKKKKKPVRETLRPKRTRQKVLLPVLQNQLPPPQRCKSL